jgi:diaminohydroxyphosphoribosylaminopyrimidine deaminase/5-amino-6-(5-phosphoribosylamino)uracil reductase
VVVDSSLRLPPTAKLVTSAPQVPTWIVTAQNGSDQQLCNALILRGQGVTLIEVSTTPDGRVDPAAAMAALASRGITRVLVEGGASMAGALLGAGLVDRLEWFRAASLIGGDGLPAVAGFGVEALAAMALFERIAVRSAGADLAESYRRIPAKASV